MKDSIFRKKRILDPLYRSIMKTLLSLLFMLMLHAAALEMEVLSATVNEDNMQLEVLMTNSKTQPVSLITHSAFLSELDFDIEHDKELSICLHYVNQHPNRKVTLEPGAQIHITLHYDIYRAKPGIYPLSLYLRNNEEYSKKKPFKLRIEHSINRPEILKHYKARP